VAGRFRGNAGDEVIDSGPGLQRSRGIARLSQFIDYALFLVYALLVTRFLLSLIAARSSAGFVAFIRRLSEPFFAPFRNIVTSPTIGEGTTLVMPIVVALGAYMLLHLVINRLLRLIAIRKTEI